MGGWADRLVRDVINPGTGRPQASSCLSPAFGPPLPVHRINLPPSPVHVFSGDGGLTYTSWLLVFT